MYLHCRGAGVFRACMYACMHVYRYASIYVCIYLCMHVYHYASIYVCMYTTMHLSMYFYLVRAQRTYASIYARTIIMPPYMHALS